MVVPSALILRSCPFSNSHYMTPASPEDPLRDAKLVGERWRFWVIFVAICLSIVLSALDMVRRPLLANPAHGYL
jgi:hypothetical protein